MTSPVLLITDWQIQIGFLNSPRLSAGGKARDQRLFLKLHFPIQIFFRKGILMLLFPASRHFALTRRAVLKKARMAKGASSGATAPRSATFGDFHRQPAIRSIKPAKPTTVHPGAKRL